MLDNNSDPNQLSRLDLLRLAHSLHVSDADVMTRAELQTAIEKARLPEPRPAAQPVTWVSVARRLLASIVEQGLNLPDAAALIRGDTKLSTPPKAPPPGATVTLARIYAAQGHVSRAIRTLDQVLESEPDHERAGALRAQLEEKRQRDKASGAQTRAEAAESTADAAGSEPSVSAPVSSVEGVLAAAAKEPAQKLTESSSSAAAPGVNEVSAFDPERPTLAGVSQSEREAPDLTDPTHLALSDAAGGEPEPPTNGAAIKEAPPSSEGSAADAHVAAFIEAPSTPEPVEAAGPSLRAPFTPTPPAEPAFAASSPPTEAAPAEALPTEALPAAPSSAVPAAALVVPVPAPPLVSALLLLETSAPVSYLYWELAASAATPGEPCWIWVVAHTPTDGGSNRLELRLPVYRSWGAIRIEGVPRHAVLRAKLTQASTADAKPLVVAAAVRTDKLGAPDAIEVLFSPHPKLNPLALANRAAHLLEDANAVYWDRL